MKQYTILRVTGNEVICREVNLLKRPEFPSFAYGSNMIGSDYEVMDELREQYEILLRDWLWAEKNLKEYPLLESNPIEGTRIIQNKENGTYCETSFKIYQVGEIIKGEVIFDSVTDKVKVI